MKVIRLIFSITLAVALTIALFTMKNTTEKAKKNISDSETEVLPGKILMPSRKLSRFLGEKPRNPSAPDHCKKDNDVCDQVWGLEGRNSTCCNNKCVDLIYDANNCGACKKKCLPSEACCNGQCVNLSYDKSHCGACNKKCMPGGYCTYDICDYA